MNSLNLLSARVIGQTNADTSSKGRPRSRSEGNAGIGFNDGQPPKRSASQHAGSVTHSEEKEPWASDDEVDRVVRDRHVTPEEVNEKTPLLVEQKPAVPPNAKHYKFQLVTRRLLEALSASLKWMLSALAAPGVYVITCFYNEKGSFSPFSPLRKFGGAVPKRGGRKSTAQAVGLSGSPDHPSNSGTEGRNGRRIPPVKLPRRNPSTSTSGGSANSESEADVMEKEHDGKAPQSGRLKVQPSSSSDEAPTRRSIRIKLYNDDTARRRKQKRPENSMASDSKALSTENQPPLTMATIKSPTSPASSLRMTRYPRAPAPPRPLVPRRQPSYSLPTSRSSSRLAQKTLVIDLDETLIHSLAKGGRMSSGHMVEVKLSSAVGYGGTTLGPQHPILYYVHKRPHCDEFLRKVCRWYNLVVFTASVQEYADPVIDWLEQERQYFSGRYYRQHCTFRTGAYIKDLSSVEPDLSKVMILDNSPLSYIFHEDNAIPIEGWINDPTDNDLLHLIPLLEALQYVTDVRALLALRRGQTEISP